MDITNSLIVKNTALDIGGGLENFFGNLRIAFSTIATNKASFESRPDVGRSLGGGLYVYHGDKGGKVSIGSSVLAENTGFNGQPSDCFTQDNGTKITGYRHIIVGALTSDCQLEDHVYKDLTGVDVGDSINPLVPGFNYVTSSSAYLLTEQYRPKYSSILIDNGERKFTQGATFFSCPNDDLKHTQRPRGLACDIGALEY